MPGRCTSNLSSEIFCRFGEKSSQVSEFSSLMNGKDR